MLCLSVLLLVTWPLQSFVFDQRENSNSPHSSSSASLTTTTYVQCSGQIINGMRSGWTTPQDSALLFQIPVHTHSEWPSPDEPWSGLTASAPVSDVSTPACTNGVWPPLRPVSAAQNNKSSTMSSSNVQSINLPTDCTAWRFWTLRQPNGCSTPAPKSSAAKQWKRRTRSNERRKGKITTAYIVCLMWRHLQVVDQGKGWKHMAKGSFDSTQLPLRWNVRQRGLWIHTIPSQLSLVRQFFQIWESDSCSDSDYHRCNQTSATFLRNGICKAHPEYCYCK